jgi:hypothetical protein
MRFLTPCDADGDPVEEVAATFSQSMRVFVVSQNSSGACAHLIPSASVPCTGQPRVVASKMDTQNGTRYGFFSQ